MILCSLAWHVKSDEKRTDLLTGEAGQSGCDANSCASYRGQRWMLLAESERPDSRFLISSEDRFTRGGLPFVSVSPSTIPAGIRNISRVDSLRAHPAIGRIQCKKTLRRASAQRCLHRGVRPRTDAGETLYRDHPWRYLFTLLTSGQSRSAGCCRRCRHGTRSAHVGSIRQLVNRAGFQRLGSRQSFKTPATATRGAFSRETRARLP